jgi:pimeloyl-ACP methyl ester carboxylesterase
MLPHEAMEQPLPWAPSIRGLRWAGGPDTVFLLHEPGSDVDAWGALPVRIARRLAVDTVALDLPGHGLSDDPWEPARLPELLRELTNIAPETKRRLVIAAGCVALTSLELAAELELGGLVCLSPMAPSDGSRVQRSPSVPKLFVAGSLRERDLVTARGLAAACGGWSVVTSLPVSERGTGLLTSAWRGRVVEDIVTFLRDCQRRPTQMDITTGRPRRYPGRTPF